MNGDSNFDKLRIEAIFPRDKDTLDILWNKYIKKIFNYFKYENGIHSLEFISYKTLQCPFSTIKFGDMIYFFKGRTTDNMLFRPVNCPYWFICEIDQNKEYIIGSMDRNFDFKRFVRSEDGSKMLEQFIFESTMLYLMILYMSEKPEYFQIDDMSRQQIKKSENSKDRKANCKYTKIVKNYFVSKEKANKSHNEIQCPVWSVRGHYRHYKNGNVIFINEYRKGKERKEKEPQTKVYKLGKNKEMEDNHG